jgi:hypothetical protein
LFQNALQRPFKGLSLAVSILPTMPFESIVPGKRRPDIGNLNRPNGSFPQNRLDSPKLLQGFLQGFVEGNDGIQRLAFLLLGSA